MNNGWYKCSYERHHRTKAEAEACPGCLTTFPPRTRQRRNAVVASMLPGSPHPVPRSPSASWETVSSTPQSSRAVSPAEIPKSAGAAYPTPSCSQNHPQNYSQERRGAISGSPGSPSRAPFTARGELPGPPVTANGNSARYSYDLLGNLETTPASQGAPRDYTTPLPPLSPPPPMAPRKHRNTRTATPAPSILVPETRASGSPTTNRDNALPSIETPIPPNTPNQNPNHNQAHQLSTLRTSHLTLTRQLQDSTALVERLHTRANIADIERDHAVAAREAAQAELERARGERDAARGGRFACRVMFKALVVIVVLYLVYRLVLYGPEFEYIWKRTREGLGLEKER